MKKSKFVKELERIIDMVKTGDDGFEYGGKVIFYKEDDDNYEILVKNIEMNLMVEANRCRERHEEEGKGRVFSRCLFLYRM